MNLFEEWLDMNELKRERHQLEAVEWALQRERSETLTKKGGIIADEMGLGKTIEILGTVYSNKLPNTLIVLPYSLLGQWEKIIVKLFGVQPLIFHGAKRLRLSEEDIKFHPIVITTYGLISLRKEANEVANEVAEAVAEAQVQAANVNPLYNIKWDRIIYDEAHHLRNKKTSVNEGAHMLKSDITWLMTGTPIQNGIKDLYSLFDLLGVNARKLNVKDLIGEYMLRRTKEEAGINLPACHRSIINVDWNYDREKKLADNIHTKLASACSKSEEFKLIAKAKKICTFPRLMKERRRVLILEGNKGIPKCIRAIKEASKIESVVKAVLSRKDNGKPKLIFSYFHGEIDEIYSLLRNSGMNVKKFDGRTSKKERAKILLEPCEVLIGQIEATNEGLNLQAYKEIYIVSPQWNPAVEDQAIARCHRIGQTDEVQVFHFIMGSLANNDDDANGNADANDDKITIDQYIVNVQERKRTLIENTF
jgi:SNF2 family DNA or RNA helicase